MHNTQRGANTALRLLQLLLLFKPRNVLRNLKKNLKRTHIIHVFILIKVLLFLSMEKICTISGLLKKE